MKEWNCFPCITFKDSQEYWFEYVVIYLFGKCSLKHVMLIQWMWKEKLLRRSSFPIYQVTDSSIRTLLFETVWQGMFHLVIGSVGQIQGFHDLNKFFPAFRQSRIVAFFFVHGGDGPTSVIVTWIEPVCVGQ